MSGTVNILGIEFSTMTLQETMNFICCKVDEYAGKTTHIITTNPEIAIQMQEDSEFKKISLEADLITPDGVGIIWASRLKGAPISERVTGYDLLLECLKYGNEKGWSFYFLGSEESVSRNMEQHVNKTYPNIRVSGRHNGFFSKEEELKIVSEIEFLKPDILIVAFGAPLTDKWIYRYKDRITVKVTFGVGGSMDVITGKVERTPEIWKKLNLEWLHRRIIMPSRKERQKRLKIFASKVIQEALGRNH